MKEKKYTVSSGCMNSKLEEFKKMVVNTDTVDRDKATEAIHKLTMHLSDKKPNVFFVKGMNELNRFYCLYARYKNASNPERKKITPDEKNELMNMVREMGADNCLGEPVNDYVHNSISMLSKYIMIFFQFSLVAQTLYNEHIVCDVVDRNRVNRFFDTLSRIQGDYDHLWMRKVKYTQHRSVLSATRFLYYDEILKQVPELYMAECKNKKFRDFEEFAGLVKGLFNTCSSFLILDDMCVIGDRVEHIHFNRQEMIHSDGKPAYQSRDGVKFWFLNNVSVSQEIAETPFDKLDIKRLLFSETNAEVRREIIRKVGAECMYKKLDPVILHKASYMSKSGDNLEDTTHDYELIEIDYKAHKGRALKMINPSTGFWHIEWVDENCETVQDALEFRQSRLVTGKTGDSFRFPDILT